MSVLRRLARSILPYEVRLPIAVARRAWRDRRAGTAFAVQGRGRSRPAFEHGAYELRFIDYPGQEGLARAKRHNQRLLGQALDGTVVRPGETFSLWRLAGRPTAAAGYAAAAAIKGGRLTTDMGGSTCLLSTVMYNAALLAGMEIVERWAHSVDTYGDSRYFELGRDCSIEYGYRDLRFRNGFGYPVTVSVELSDELVRVAIGADQPREFAVDLTVSEPIREASPVRVVFDPGLRPGEERVIEPGYGGLCTSTVRTLTWPDGTRREDDLGESRHQSTPHVVARAQEGGVHLHLPFVGGRHGRHRAVHR
ncbi:MAG: VanW family protein [Chloroflexi bacterium]|nr:VanW family protein [Chloroflexota bacterium]